MQRGAQRGRELGYPTINMQLKRLLTPGVYVSETRIGRKWLPSATFVGAAETFGETELRIETFILDFSRDLYGQTVSVRLHEYLRPGAAYRHPQELVRRMEQDVAAVREYFRSGVV